MRSVIRALVSFVVSFFRARAAMQLEILALRHQLTVCHRSAKRPQLQPADRVNVQMVRRLVQQQKPPIRQEQLRQGRPAW